PKQPVAEWHLCVSVFGMKRQVLPCRRRIPVFPGSSDLSNRRLNPFKTSHENFFAPLPDGLGVRIFQRDNVASCLGNSLGAPRRERWGDGLRGWPPLLVSLPDDSGTGFFDRSPAPVRVQEPDALRLGHPRPLSARTDLPGMDAAVES